MPSFINRISFLFILLFFTFSLFCAPKREFRGVWVQTAFQEHYQQKSEADLRRYFTEMLDCFKDAGFNALIFQVRPSADAFFKSEKEPWSRFLTGERGKSLNSNWDPMEFLINECHNRNIEFHAWINPYRVTVSSSETLPKNHLYYR